MLISNEDTTVNFVNPALAPISVRPEPPPPALHFHSAPLQDFRPPEDILDPDTQNAESGSSSEAPILSDLDLSFLDIDPKTWLPPYDPNAFLPTADADCTPA